MCDTYRYTPQWHTPLIPAKVGLRFEPEGDLGRSGTLRDTEHAMQRELGEYEVLLSKRVLKRSGRDRKGETRRERKRKGEREERGGGERQRAATSEQWRDRRGWRFALGPLEGTWEWAELDLKGQGTDWEGKHNPNSRWISELQKSLV